MASSFRESKDGSAFDAYRRAINYGGRVRDTVVSPRSAIAARVVDLLQYLARTRPADGWGEYADARSVHWDKLILAGHSQGAGHAAYLAQRQSVAGVLILGGPQDYLKLLGRPAPWLSARSKTAPDLFRTLLHRDDEFDVELQLLANKALRGKGDVPVTRVGEQLPEATARIVISERPLPAALVAERAKNPGLHAAHVSLIQPEYGPLWLHLLEH